MKVAIIGAGLSGLACAYELERRGITPTIFEKKPYIGEVLELSVMLFHQFNVPVWNPLEYLQKKHQLELKPNYPLREVVFVSPNKTGTVRGNLGYIFRRDNSRESLTNQMVNVVSTPIKLETEVDIDDIRMDYDYVVIATGTVNFAKRMNVFSPNFRAFVRIAKVKGTFKTDSAQMWFNTKYANTGFAYLTPNTTEEAYLALIVDNIRGSELDHHWRDFLSTENISYEIVDTKDLEHETGFVSPVQVGNTYFVGYAGGFIDNTTGFGSIKAVMSGALAGKSIANSLDFNKVMRKFTKDLRDKNEFRKAVDTFKDKDFDLAVSLVTLPGISSFLYSIPFIKVTQATFLAKAFNRIKRG